jgi:hypothetical protein
MDRNALLAAMDIVASEKPTPVTIEAWGQTVYVKALTAVEFEENTADADDPKSKNKAARAACRVLCDESGQRLFDPSNEADVQRLARQPWALLRRILAATEFQDKPRTGKGAASGN